MKKSIIVVSIFAVLFFVTVLNVEALGESKVVTNPFVKQPINKVEKIVGEKVKTQVDILKDEEVMQEFSTSSINSETEELIPDTNYVQCPFGNVQCNGNHEKNNCFNDTHKDGHNGNFKKQSNGAHHGGHNRR